ncbi:MAG: hypothetical protein H0T17_03285 [Propionibacteriales bacterium]|nr:hypothetical protein [Propionibacteriales bacterium]
MKRLASLVAILVLSVGSLTSCSGDEYCGKLKDYDKDESLRNANATTTEGQRRIVAVLDDLKDSAPSELEDEYATVVSGLNSVMDGKPEDVDQRKLQDAYTAISKDAKDSCDVDMG